MLRCPCLLPIICSRPILSPALVDKSPMVAGAIKTIDEVKKMARHSSSQQRDSIPYHHESFFDSRFHGWGDKSKLEEGWKLTHGEESVHESAAVRKAEAASRKAAKGDADSGDGFFDSWGKVSPKSHIGGKITVSTPLMTSSATPSTQASSSPSPSSSVANTPQTHVSGGGAGKGSNLEPPPLPSFLKKGEDPLHDARQVANREKERKAEAHGGDGSGTAEHAKRDPSSEGGEEASTHAASGKGARSEGVEGRQRDPIDKLIALQRLKRKQKERALVRFRA